MKINEKINQNVVLRGLIKYLIIIVGSIIYAVGFQFFMYPNSIVSGGVVGIAMIVNRLTDFPVGVLTIVLNLPLFVVGWKHFGLDFMVSSFVGMVLSSAFVDIFALTNIALTDDPMLACIIGGAIKGVGLGIIYYVGASTGGIDIIAKMLRKRFAHINFGTIVLILDFFIIGAYALVLGKYETSMYSIIAMVVSTKLIDLVLYGMDNSSICYIISEKSDTLIKDIITGHLKRGVTILNGEGAYSHHAKQVLMCVIKRTQFAELKKIVKSVDEDAFFIVTDAKNVFGNGFDSISEVR